MTYRCTRTLPSPSRTAMKLLVFAHIPPPVHGQSLMVQTMIAGMGADPHLQLLHVNPQLSRDSRDIGRWRLGKVFTLLRACREAWRLRRRHGPAFFYYIPAPGKRSALYRDFLVMLLCRPFFSGLVLHWHAVGLGAWLQHHATPPERWLAQRLLGRAALAIVLGENLRADAAVLRPRRIAVVRNGIKDPDTATPAEASARSRAPFPAAPLEAVFLGLCSREKGLFDAVAAVQLANTRAPAAGKPSIRLRVAGDFPDAGTERAFADALTPGDDTIRHVGFVTGAEKTALLRSAGVLIFPTRYPHEAQPLVIAEALAFDVPVITTRWRAVHEGLPEAHIYLVEPNRPEEIAAALERIRGAGSPRGVLRQHFLAHFTQERHLANFAEALRSLGT